MFIAFTGCEMSSLEIEEVVGIRQMIQSLKSPETQESLSEIIKEANEIVDIDQSDLITCTLHGCHL